MTLKKFNEKKFNHYGDNIHVQYRIGPKVANASGLWEGGETSDYVIIKENGVKHKIHYNQIMTLKGG